MVFNFVPVFVSNSKCGETCKYSVNKRVRYKRNFLEGYTSESALMTQFTKLACNTFFDGNSGGLI